MTTTVDVRFLNMKEAALYIGRSYRWMQRHYIDLIRSGVKVARLPKGSIKGRLVFEKESLSQYMDACRIPKRFSILEE